MPTKVQFYAELADRQSRQVTQSREQWTDFLSTAGRLYKYPFEEQLVIYAQRPDATACAPLETWNKPMNRYVRAGSKGIALIDITSGKPRLKYVFDVSDTEDSRRNARRPFLWEIKAEHESTVMEALAKYDADLDGDMGNILWGLAHSLATRYYDDNARDIHYSVEGSFLEELDDFNIGVTFREALTVSTAYTLMSRCGIDPADYIEDEDFQCVFDFNTPETVVTLGKAVSLTTEEVLRDVEVTIKRYERTKLQERNDTVERDNLHAERRLSDTRHPDSGDEPFAGQIRHDEEVVSGEASPDDLHDVRPEGETVPPLPGDRESSERAIGSDDGTTDTAVPAARQGDKPDGLDSAYEQPESSGGGNYSNRTDIQLDSDTAEASSDTEGAFSTEITDADIDRSLSRGSQIEHGKFRIYSYFLHDHSTAEKARFLKDEYGTGGGTRTFSDGSQGWENHASSGLELIKGSLREPDAEVKLTWTNVANRIDRLITDGQYMSQSELDHIPAYECQMLGAGVANFFQGLPLDMERPFDSGDNDYWGTASKIGDTLDNPETLEKILAAMRPIMVNTPEGDRYHNIRRSAYDDLTAFANGTFTLFPIPQAAQITLFPTEQMQIAEIQEAEQLTLAALPVVSSAEDAAPPVPVTEAPTPIGTPEPVFFVDWDTAQHDFDLSRYNDGDIIGYNKDGVEYAVGRSGNFTYITNTTMMTPWGEVLGYRDIPQNILEQIRAYRNGELSDEQVRADYLAALSGSEPTPMPEPEPVAPARERRNFNITDENLGHGSKSERFRANITAIRLLKELETEDRLATPDEQEVLSRYVGWGSLPEAFEESRPQYRELKSRLTDEEFAAARASTLNAHYTSPTVIRAMYDTLERLGFKSGNILEPACGVGNFFGMLPDSMSGSKLYGVELDSITGRIAKQLYQNADIKITGFENTDTPDAFFDVVVGNVPFGAYKVPDRRYDKHGFSIHDYFFAKSLDQVRPGGIVAFVTSKWTMDKQNLDVRKYIAQRAELLGAVRLPNNAFKANAGTEVTSDIIFLQKRDRLLDIEPGWVQLGLTDDGIPVNSYFAENSHMILGTMTTESTQYGHDTTCRPIEDADLAEQLKAALSYVQGQITEVELDDIEGIQDISIPADPSVRNFSYTVIDDIVYYRENSRMNPVDMPATTLERVKGMVELRDCCHQLIDYQLYDYSDSDIRKKQAELNTLYDSFARKFGLINDSANSKAFSADSAYYLLCSLEVLDENNELERKSDMFTKRTIKQKSVVTSVDTAADALAVSISQKALVDMDYMCELTGFSQEKIVADLQGVIFLNVGGAESQEKTYVTADEYLSGNVREKLRLVRAAAETLGDGSLDINIRALEAAQPKDLEVSEISVRLGSTWVDKAYVRDFMYELLQTPFYLKSRGSSKGAIDVNYSEHTGEWNVTGKTKASYNDVLANTTYGTTRKNAYQIIEDTLNLKDVRVYDTLVRDGKETRVLNKKETTLAQQKQESIKRAFKDWIFNNPERRHDLVQLYNEKFNSTRPREYDGSHIEFAGMSPEIELKDHQTSAIARILYGGNTLLAHEVGAGKTFEMVGAAMESKRLGLCQKSLIAVPNHLTEQWASEFLRLYPSANILIATKKDFETKNRKKFCAKIATGDYDAVIIGHSQLEKIPLSKERQERLLEEQIFEVTEGISELKRNNGERFTIKQLEKTRKSLEARLKKLTDDTRKDDVVTFEQLGVDRLFVDESHNFKNLFTITKMRNVAGVSQTEAQKSSDLFMKCRYMDEITGSKGIIFATGTPVSNSMTELFTMQRYLQYDMLQSKNLMHFDCWASTFGETQTVLELAPEGSSYRARTRFSKFHNLPELMTMFKEVADIKTADTLDLPRPKANYHTIVAEPTELQSEMIADLSERAKAVHNKLVDPHSDNMLKITSDGRKIGLDQRLINPLLPDDEQSKVNLCAENIYRIWDETSDKRLTQLAFCDYSTPNADGRFNVYDDIREKLIAKGVPEDEIAFIHDANTEVKKKELFAKVRQGKVRVMFGSTAKMGAGTNVQDRLIAIHDIDAPWRPADLEQRAGRIVRQGNQNPEVDIYRYCTAKSFDAYLWQTLENKQKFISQIMTSKSPVRTADDIDESVLSYAEIKALCAGNPLIKERMDLDIEVARLRLLKSDHQTQHYRLQDNLLTHFPTRIEAVKGHIDGFKSDISRLEVNTHVGEEGISPMTISDKTYTDRGEAGAALLEACKGIKSTEPVKIGSYRGFEMLISFESFTKSFKLDMKGAMTHTAELGRDAYGNITRINNTFEKIPGRLRSVEVQLQTLYEQVENAKIEVEKPFEFEQALAEKTARLVELDALLDLDHADTPELGGDDSAEELDELDTEHISAKSKPSILGALKEYKEEIRASATEKPRSAEVSL